MFGFCTSITMEESYRKIEKLDDTAELYQDKEVPSHLVDSSQKYCICSVVAPQGTNQVSKQLAIRIHGCRASVQEANKWARALRDSNPYFDVYCVQCNEWAVLPPHIGSIEDVNTTDDKLNEIFAAFKAEEKAKKQDMEKRLEQAHAKKKKIKN